ncbi:Glutathione import ATP-binding protein GsiA [Kingella potus]|uniref:Glutathione import ATP-binding protein GsiA n=1 Tax=Kingella potus TaxID=265175 RepID=A0A377R0V0_9NEIS|nr:dipeptide ABC transporter ATP-binding protein [Kingella potus]STQ99951.1 Glutathione import ATP-binding protein GsiA [Kingella potus]
MDNILNIQNLNAFFGRTQVLYDIGFSVRRGSKTAIVGESGSGKTVLAQGIMRLNPAVSLEGRLDFNGENLLGLAPRALQKLRGRKIGMVFQEPMTALNPVMAVGAQIAEVLTLHLGLDKKQAWAKAVSLLAETGIREPEQKAADYPFRLSGGQRQRAMIAMAAAAEPELLIADEPTTALDAAVQAQILALLSRMQEAHNMTLLYITHDLNLVRRFADDIIVMRHGRIVEQGAAREVFRRPQHEYTKMLLEAAPQRSVAPLPPDSPAVLQAEDIGVSVPQKSGWFSSREKVLLRPLSFELKAGETLGVIGESGSGKTTLAQALMRLIEATGRLKTNGRDWQPQSRRDIQMVFQDPFSAFNPRMTAADIVSEPLRVHEPQLDKHERRRRAAEAIAQVGLPADAPSRYPHEFSGGQRQRLALARAVIVQPKILVLDEPTSALDVQWQQQILALLSGLQRQYGLSLIIISHDLAVIRALAHRVMVLKNGEVVEEGDCEQVFARPQHEYTRTLAAHYRNTYE